jgi:glycyl-tRNA synthetase beta chain
MAHDLFFEIGVEEVPARFLKTAMSDLERLLSEGLRNHRLDFEEISVTATPRRLVGYAHNISLAQKDEITERLGPAWQAAFDEDGQLTKAAAGFAKSQGATAEDIIKIETPKGPRAGIRKKIVGRPAREIAGPMLAALMKDIPWPKSMRWSVEPQRFVRPIQWITALLDGEIIELSFAGVKATANTYGHRFHSPQAISVESYEDYRAKLKTARVVVDYYERRKLIAGGLEKAARDIGGEFDAKSAEKLIDEVTGLTEWPVVHVGSIPDQYMELPKPVLVTTMAGHQKYFNFLRPDSPDLMPKFVAVSGSEVSDKALVTKGYERVLNARLADAKFFWTEDLRTPLEKFAENLDGVIFHRKLGSYKDKITRAQSIGQWLAGKVAPGLTEMTARALKLSKADLLTNMVGELPELQGIMGYEYALIQGEPKSVADAIREHYLPRFAGDALPETELGAICSIADKMDSIVAGAGVGLAPTGAGDPYALRRQALGVIQVLRQRQWRIPIEELIDIAAKAAKDKIRMESGELLRLATEFFRLRLSNMLKTEGAPSEIVDGVVAVRFSDIVEVVDRVQAVAQFSESKDYKAFAAAFKRVANIIGDHVESTVDPTLFEDDKEKNLWDAYLGIRTKAGELVNQRKHLEALELIAKIRPVVDDFFDSVLVMAKEEKVRSNRLSLLLNVASMFSNIADFKKM